MSRSSQARYSHFNWGHKYWPEYRVGAGCRFLSIICLGKSITIFNGTTRRQSHKNMRSHRGAAKKREEDSTLLLHGLWRWSRWGRGWGCGCQQASHRQNNPLEAPQGTFNLARTLRHELKIKSIGRLPHGYKLGILSRNGHFTGHSQHLHFGAYYEMESCLVFGSSHRGLTC